jgi:hypothetical protein
MKAIGWTILPGQQSLCPFPALRCCVVGLRGELARVFVAPGGVCRPEVGVRNAVGTSSTIFRRWAFDASLRRMTTAVVSASGATDDGRVPIRLLCKGAPEVSH